MEDTEPEPSWTVDEILAANDRPPVEETTGPGRHSWAAQGCEEPIPEPEPSRWRQLLSTYGLRPPLTLSR
jgi:hypothetical protein